jgi:hypothetical protein
MARKVVAMEARLLAVFTAGLKGVSVSELCAELGYLGRRFTSIGVVSTLRVRRGWLSGRAGRAGRRE